MGTDIVLNFFRTPHWLKKQNQIPVKQVARKYLAFYFWIDLVSLIPLFLMNRILHFTYLIRLRHLWRSLYYIIFFTGKIITKIKSSAGSLKLIDLIRRFLKIFTILIVTFQILVALLLYQYELLKIERHNLSDENQHMSIVVYISVFYEIVVTATTVGYGDITPDNVYLMITTICIQIMGIIFFGFVMTKVRQAIETNYGYLHYVLE